MIEKPATYTQFDVLKRELTKQPLHTARSFELAQVRGSMRVRQDSFSRVTSPIFPKTGVRFIDSVNWKISDMLRLGKESLLDFPKAIVKGGFYGALGGAIVGFVNYARHLHLKPDPWSVGVAACAVIAGGFIGAGIRFTNECWVKFRQFKNIFA